jgi:membrane protein DedA with SNARE-associated domain
MTCVADYLFTLILGVMVGRSLEAHYPDSLWVSALVFAVLAAVMVIRIRQWRRDGQAMRRGERS